MGKYKNKANIKYNNATKAKNRYNHMEEGKRANQCQGCGACEAVCPQKLSIRDNLAQFAAEVNNF